MTVRGSLRIPVDPDMLDLMKKWNRDDLPTAFERSRNGKIAEIQKKRNRFIDQPSLASRLKCKVP